MIIFTDNGEKIDKLAHADLQFMGKQLIDFVNIYRNKIYIENDEHVEILNHLEKIALMIRAQRYNELLNDTSIINYMEDTEIPF